LWHEQLKDVDPARLVFLDESGTQTSMTRTHGRAPRGERLVSKVPAGHWKIVTMISAIRLGGPFAAASVIGPTDSDLFRTYVAQVLVPQLRPGDVVMMDNLSPHKAPGVREAIESVGASLHYLPPYSPDFNPIENMWSKLKRRLRSIAARSIESLHEAIGTALQSISSSDCHGFFRGCGYHATGKGALL
jgi:transposase